MVFKQVKSFWLHTKRGIKNALFQAIASFASIMMLKIGEVSL